MQVRYQLGAANPEGYILGYTGMCRSSKGSLFHKKYFNMAPIFYKNIPKHWTVFVTEPKFWGVSHANTRILAKTGLYFIEEPLLCPLFCQK